MLPNVDRKRGMAWKDTPASAGRTLIIARTVSMLLIVGAKVLPRCYPRRRTRDRQPAPLCLPALPLPTRPPRTA